MAPHFASWLVFNIQTISTNFLFLCRMLSLFTYFLASIVVEKVVVNSLHEPLQFFWWGFSLSAIKKGVPVYRPSNAEGVWIYFQITRRCGLKEKQETPVPTAIVLGAAVWAGYLSDATYCNHSTRLWMIRMLDEGSNQMDHLSLDYIQLFESWGSCTHPGW